MPACPPQRGAEESSQSCAPPDELQTHSSTKGNTMKDGNHHDWIKLIGQRVEVWKEGKLVRTGRVDDVVHAADALWLAGHGVERRALYQEAEGYSIRSASGSAQCVS